MKEMMDLINSTQTRQTEGESHLKDLQEYLDFIGVKFDEYEKDKKEKKCFLENNLMNETNKILYQMYVLHRIA